MKRSEKAQKIGLILDKLYPETPTPLDHYSAYTLLVAVMLSAQTTDKKVNQVTPALFKKADTPEAMSKLNVKTIQNLIKEIGLAPTKANNLKRKAPKTATIILPPTVDSLSDVKINEPKYIIIINTEMGKKISL